MKTLPGGAANPNYRDFFDISANTPMAARDKFVRSVLRLEYVTDSGIKFRSVSSYQKAETRYGTDLDVTASDYPGALNYNFYDNVQERQLTQEFNVISPDNQRFTWLLGAFGLWNKYDFPAPYDNFDINVCYPYSAALVPACHYQLKGTNPERSLAVFGQRGFNISDSLQLEVGGRYTGSRSTNHVDVMQYGLYIRDAQTTKSDNFSYKVSLGWKVSPDNYLYGFVATGFRPGGLNVPVTTTALLDPFEPEKVTSFEAGWKANFAGGRVRTTVDGVYNAYKNFQVIIGYPLLPTFGDENNEPHTTTIYGIEAEIEAHAGGYSCGRANRMSGALAALGRAQGRRLGTLAGNTRHHLEIYYATMGMGVVCHTLNPRLTAAQLAVMIDEAEDTVIAVAGDLVPLALELAQLCPQVRHVIVLDTPIALAVQSDKVQLWDYETLLADKGEAVAWGAFAEETPAGLCYTSGTTGEPKGVRYTHRSNYLHTLRSLQTDAFAISARDTVLVAVPMFHANGWGLQFSVPAAGARMILPGRKLDGANLARLMREENVTVAVGVPTIWLGVLDWFDQHGGRD